MVTVQTSAVIVYSLRGSSLSHDVSNSTVGWHPWVSVDDYHDI